MPLIGQGDATPAGARRFASVYCVTDNPALPNAAPGIQFRSCLVGHLFFSSGGGYAHTIEPWQKGDRFSFPVKDGDWDDVFPLLPRYRDFKRTKKAVEEIQKMLKEIEEIRANPAGWAGLPNSTQRKRLYALLLSYNQQPFIIETYTGAEFNDPGVDGTPGSERIALMEKLRGLLLLFGNPPEGGPIPPAGLGEQGAGTAGRPMKPILFGPGIKTKGTIVMTGKRCGPVTVTWELIGARRSTPTVGGEILPEKKGRLKLTATPSHCFIQIVGNQGAPITIPRSMREAARIAGYDIKEDFPGLFPASPPVTHN